MGEGMPGGGEPPQKTPEDIAKIQQERLMSDVEALKGGATMTPEGKVEHASAQVEAARGEMEADLSAGSEEGKIVEAEKRGAEKGERLEGRLSQAEKFFYDAQFSLSALVNEVDQVSESASTFGGIDTKEGSLTRRKLEGIVDRTDEVWKSLQSLAREYNVNETGDHYFGDGNFELPDTSKIKEVFAGKGKLSRDDMDNMRNQALRANSNIKFLYKLLKGIKTKSQ